ncbi:hypothetical protein H8F22_29500 [Pseudomonas sp. P154a]|jgi:hypothetical protein|uniref:hypothetical protein n=1 Tax=Pseudomonas mucoides TaxID=2730424 RepID=UPI0018926039|nr:hypothetical protein [Pseudomonas mucoides]MBF6043025.1 hypothetical protein [Pseudomonas mucoides]
MLLKELVFSLRQNLAEQTGEKPSVGHTYELLSALLGYDSFASLNSQAFIVLLSGCDGNAVENVRLLLAGLLDLRRATERHVALQAAGSPRLTALVVESFAQRHELAAIPLAGVLGLYDDQVSIDHATEFALEELHGCFLDMEPPQLRLSLGMLEDFSCKNPSAHYALFRIYERLVKHHDSGSVYWLLQMRLGRQLSGSEKQLAVEALFEEGLIERAEFHLSKASASGHAEAIFFELDELQKRIAVTAEDFAVLDSHAGVPGLAGRVATLAEAAGLTLLAMSWSQVAARNGDTEALHRLVSADRDAPTVETWTWIHLSRLLGRDVTVGTLRAYHAGGQYAGEEFDDDQGGDFYVDGDEGLDIAPMSAELDRDAQAAAAIIYERIQNGHSKT